MHAFFSLLVKYCMWAESFSATCGCAVLLVGSSGTLLHHIFRLACGVTLSYATLQLSSSLKGHVGHNFDHNCLHSVNVYRLAMSVLCKQEGVSDLGVTFNTDCNLREQYNIIIGATAELTNSGSHWD